MTLDRVRNGMGDLYEPEPNTGCWLWVAAIDHWGYGSLSCEGKPWRANRLMYEIHHGDIPPGMLVRHKCDCKTCVNPDHLELGDKKSNWEDMATRQKLGYGEKSGRAKFTNDQVIKIRERLASGETQRSIAREYSVNQSTISRIHTGDNWWRVQKS